MQYICATGNLYHGRMAQRSAVQRGGTVQMLSGSSPLACKLFWIGLDWIVLHTNENMESMLKGRIDPSAHPNLGKDQSDQLKFLEGRAWLGLVGLKLGVTSRKFGPKL